MDLVRMRSDRGMFSPKRTKICYGSNWGLGVWLLLLLEGHEPLQQSDMVGGSDGTSNSMFMGAINGSFKRKLKESKEFMVSLMRSQLPTTGQCVNAWIKTLIWCIIVGYDSSRCGLAINKRKSINYASTYLRSNWFLYYAFCNRNQGYWYFHWVKRRRK